MSETKPILRIIGSLQHPRHFKYFEFLVKRAREKRVKVEFYTNADRNKLVEVATTSKVFAHTTRFEHFGIAVVEGMTAGCPIVVHKNGGPYEDIIDFGKYGLYFETVEELAQQIDKLMTNKNTWNYYHKLSQKS